MDIYDIIGFVAEKYDCTFKHENDYVLLEWYSTAGRDVCFEFDPETENKDVVEILDDLVYNYDVNYETYIWLDNFGHGGKGAPEDIREILEDSEEILETLKYIVIDVKLIKDYLDYSGVGENITKKSME